MIIYLGENKKQVELPEGSSGLDLVEKFKLTAPEQALALKKFDQVLDLSSPLQEGDEVTLLQFDDVEGREVFWHSSAHVLAQAILRLWPDALPTIGPPIEQGFYYDFANLKISEEDFEKIEQEVQKIVAENFRPQRHRFQNKQEALQAFEANSYKKELIEGFETGPYTAYRQGEFFDLCRGPHLPSIGKLKAFKVLKTSGAYWRGDQNREMLTRVYAISFPDRKMLKEYLFIIEEAKKRDHKILGPKLGLFSLKEEAPGMPFVHPRGVVVWNRLVEFWRELRRESGYVEIKTPQIMSQELWEMSGHWKHYRQNMYSFAIEERGFAIKPMSCPGCMLYFKSDTHSYRELPMRVAELGHVHRHEASGALSGLFRVRSFHQDDSHLFMRPCDIKEEILAILKLIEKTYKTFELPYRLELSTRPKDSSGTDEDWKVATEGLKGALDEWGQPYRINEGDGAFYGPKIDIHIRDALGRSWQCGTVQLDMVLPEKFQLEYVDSDGSAKRPVMLHVAIFGSVERFFGILIEHFAGRFPLWMSPLPLRIITVADRHIPYARDVQKHLEEAGFLCDIDETSESVSKKVRSAQLLQVNYMLTVGDQEVERKDVSLRTRDNVVHGSTDLSLLVKTLKEESATRALHSLFSQSKT